MASDVVTLRAGNWTSRWVPSVGMVGVSLFGGGRELLGQLGGLEAYVARGATFGIPLLHPWANRLAGFAYSAAGRDVALEAGTTPGLRTEEHGLPIHGLLAASGSWSVEETSERTLRAAFDYTQDPALLAAFPYPHRLELRVAQEAGALTVSVTLTPADPAQPVPVSFGFHPYFTLPGVPREELILRTPAMSRLELDGRGIPTGAQTREPARHGPLGDAALDAAYADLGDDGPCITIAGGGHELSMRFVEGYTHAQLFAPPGRAVVAIEPMTAPPNALLSGDGLRLATEPFTATFCVDLSEAS